MSRIGNYIRDTRIELKHVTWPTQKQAFVYTVLVIGVSALVAVFLGLVDFGFTTGLNHLIQLKG